MAIKDIASTALRGYHGVRTKVAACNYGLTGVAMSGKLGENRVMLAPFRAKFFLAKSSYYNFLARGEEDEKLSERYQKISDGAEKMGNELLDDLKYVHRAFDEIKAEKGHVPMDVLQATPSRFKSILHFRYPAIKARLEESV